MLSSPASNPQPLVSTLLLDSFRHDRARGANDDVALGLRPPFLELLASLGDPHKKLPPVFHVAGTNGKGSTCAFLRSMLEAADKSAHVYTSPHLVRFHERIRIAGKLIEETELVEILTQCRNAATANEVTYFEAATAAAFTAFARHPADFTILEVGLGGRLDATNIIPQPLASIITRISFDHRDYLGNSIKAIAREKAGIMRKGTPCFSAAQPNDGTLETLRAEAKRMGAPLFVEGNDWRVEQVADGFRFCGNKPPPNLPLRLRSASFGGTLVPKTATKREARRRARGEECCFTLPNPALLGEHQIHNAGLAIAALLGVQDSGFRLEEKEIAQGLRAVEWPARLQRIAKGVLAALLPEDCELWLDGGHNDSAGEALAQQAKAWREQEDLPLHVICGMLITKNPAEFLTPLRTFVARMQTVAIPDEAASFTAEDLASAARTAGFQNVAASPDVVAAIKRITSNTRKPIRILICGSLYLAGHVLKQNAEMF